ncbi:hypothetical protein BDW74DRAFT_158840 [Aspergillus multicolor]|uniref:uncharacterized protein n=1 Tax=Aspergillus multicolor TaxID=41759 RepID=UPI003CCD526D
MASNEFRQPTDLAGDSMNQTYTAMQRYLLDYIDDKIPREDPHYENKRFLPREARGWVPKEHQRRHRMSLLWGIGRMLLDFQQCHPDWLAQDIPKLKKNWERFIKGKGKNLLHELFPTSQAAPNPAIDCSLPLGVVTRRGTDDGGIQKITRRLTGFVGLRGNH